MTHDAPHAHAHGLRDAGRRRRGAALGDDDGKVVGDERYLGQDVGVAHSSPPLSARRARTRATIFGLVYQTMRAASAARPNISRNHSGLGVVSPPLPTVG